MEAGIDEAGRGPVLGPLVVAGVASPDPAYLHEIGCRDSKQLSPANRQRLARLLRSDSSIRIAVRVIEPETLDAERKNHSLNRIELDRFIEVAAELDADRVVADAADVDADRFGAAMASHLPDHWNIIAEHQADSRHPTVAAASIIAKVTRDDAIETLGRTLERQLNRPIGSGYPSDPITQGFLQQWVRQFGDLPPGTRRSWKTAQNLLPTGQSGLGDF